MTDNTTTDNLTPAQYRAVSALLSETSVRKAAEMAGVKERTVYHWLRTPAFADEYRQARREALQQAIARGQQYSGAMMGELLRLATSARSEAVRLGAARAVLEFAIKAVEIEDLAVRLETLERAYAAKL